MGMNGQLFEGYECFWLKLNNLKLILRIVGHFILFEKDSHNERITQIEQLGCFELKSRLLIKISIRFSKLKQY